MPELTRKQLHQFFKHLGEHLDIPENLRQRAEERFGSVAKWLARDGSSVRAYSPSIYPQGSFKLGTVVRPVGDGDAYDVDLVCTLNLTKRQISQQYLKNKIGDEIKAYARANNMNTPAKNGKRCWTLEYADEAQFHMDVLPSIPDGDSFRRLLEERRLSNRWADQGIAITDKSLPNYAIISDDWSLSNPKGYAAWFYNRMKTRFDEQRRFMAESAGRRIEDIPEFKVTTPLQRAIQLLKRHRDLMFIDDQDDKPISIIITTLAAHAYNNEADMVEALVNIVNGMSGYIEIVSGISWVPNPSYPLENFTDKWTEYPKRKQKFYLWLQQVETDLTEAFRSDDIRMLGKRLEHSFGERGVKEAVEYVTKSISGKTAELIATGPQLPSRFNVPHRVEPLWPVLGGYTVTVSGQINIRDKWVSIENNDSVFPKKHSLRYTAHTNVPQPYDVFWQVVNTGAEATKVNGLRGKIFPGNKENSGGLVQNESTLYRGMHWIECFIVKNGVCVARSGEFVVNIA